MLAGHIDEIGVIITYIDDEGFLYIAGIGGWDPQVLVAQRIRIMGRDGDVYGVIGKKPIHLIKPEDRKKASEMTDLWIDIGAASREEAERRVTVGDAGVIDSRTIDLPNNCIASRSVDDRIGAFIVLEALRRYAEQPGAARVVAVATTQEEIAFQGGGARVSATRVAPQMAIVVDVTHATDYPGAEKKEHGHHKIGGGPVLTRGSIISPVVYTLLRDAATRLSIPYTVHAAGRESWTDADAIHVARDGVATGLLSIPNRYMHSPNEVVSLEDLDRAAALIAEACRAVNAGTDFTAR
jgi:endoglucanase